MVTKIEIKYALFAMCYDNNGTAYLLHKSDEDPDNEIMAVYHDGLADGAERIMQKFNWMDEYRIYCDKRDRGKTHDELLAKALRR